MIKFFNDHINELKEMIKDFYVLKDNDEIVVINNRQPLSAEIKSTKMGLENLRQRLASVTKQRMSVTSTDRNFTVRIPIIKPKFTNERIDHRRRTVEC